MGAAACPIMLRELRFVYKLRFVYNFVIVLTEVPDYLHSDISADTEEFLADQVNQLDTGTLQLHYLSLGDHVKSSVRSKQANSHT